MDKKPNIVFILTDQMRGDCLGVLDHPVVKTPNLDALAQKGTVFTAAYTPCPSCIAARASIFTGQRPTTHGRLGYRDKVAWQYNHTLVELLRDNGYETHCIGKRHFYPQTIPLGFESCEYYEAMQDFGGDYVNHYFEWLKERTDVEERASGLGSNSWVGGVSCLPEEWHNNSWVVNRGIDFLENRDQERPFFLNLSFHRPHAPLDPPKDYLRMYDGCDIPPVPVGDWASRHDLPVTDKNAWQGRLPADVLADSRRSYYALITHIDAQVGRFMQAFDHLDLGPTWFVFTSDHGEMLGDHNLFRKTYAYEGSAKVPMIVAPPQGATLKQCDAPVALHDVMPTILDAVGVDIPSSVEGRSMLPLLEASPAEVNWRDYVQGEHSPCYHEDTGVQFVTDGKEKFVWYTKTGEEQFFDLANDPDELNDLTNDPAYRERIDLWRSRLANDLAERPQDGLSDGKRLLAGTNLPAVREELLQSTEA